MSLGPVLFDLRGTALDAEEAERLRHPASAGVILFTRNFASRAQLRGLIEAVRRAAGRPVLIAADHEGGRVQRFRTEFAPLPAVARLGERYDESAPRALELARETGWLLAIELLAVGIDLAFAPVLDLGRGVSSVIGDRAFHRDPETVARIARAFVGGMQEAGMAATAKHFPGHGSVALDSHHALPVDSRVYDEIEATDLVPFERLVHAGIPSVMAAHVLYEAVDDRPAGFSPFWLREVLRRRLGFGGAIVSDDLTMAGAAVAGEPADRARAALDAGCDLILVCNDPHGAGAVLDAVGTRHDPAAQLRRVRLHGRLAEAAGEYGGDRHARARAAVASLDLTEALDLDL